MFDVRRPEKAYQEFGKFSDGEKSPASDFISSPSVFLILAKLQFSSTAIIN
jgi:hypothetical protein